MRHAIAGGIAAAFVATTSADAGPIPFWDGFEGVVRGGYTYSDDAVTVPGAGGPERVIIEPDFDYFLLGMIFFFGGPEAVASSAASSAASSYSIIPFAMVSFESLRSDIEAFRQPGGAVFPTNGTERFNGVSIGGGAQIPLPIGGGLDVAARVSAHVGYGVTDIEAFSGGYQRHGNGVYFRLDTTLILPIEERANLEFGISQHYFDLNGVERHGGIAHVGLNWRF